MGTDSADHAAAPIRLVLVDDSPLALRAIQQGLSRFDDIEVVGTAANGEEALDVIARARPDVVATDLHMPRMDGLELTRRIMRERPLPIMVISVSVGAGDTENVFRLMEAGAIDVFEKPQGGLDAAHLEAYDLLARRIRVVAGVDVFRRQHSRPEVSWRRPAVGGRYPELVVVGASTGGPLALRDLLAPIPPSYPAPLVCVQHIGAGFLSGLVKWLNDSIGLDVSIARHGERPRPGRVYFAPEGRHLAFDPRGAFRYQDGDPRGGGHRPAVDVLFESAAAVFGDKVWGVLLTGMGFDGAAGMSAIRHHGGHTIAQDESTSVVFGMPAAAAAVGAVEQMVPLGTITRLLLAHAGREVETRR